MRKIDTKVAGMYAQGAAINARKQNEKNIGLWTDAQIAYAMELGRTLKAAYSPKQVYINYRKGFIVVSAQHPNPCVTQKGAIVKLTTYCNANNIEMIESCSHINLRVIA